MEFCLFHYCSKRHDSWRSKLLAIGCIRCIWFVAWMVAIAHRFTWFAKQPSHVTIRIQFTKCIAGLFAIESKLPITRIDIELFAKQSELFTNIAGIWFGQSKLLADKPKSGITAPLLASEPNIFTSFHEFVLGQLASVDEPLIPSTKLILTAITATIRKFFFCIFIQSQLFNFPFLFV